MYDSIIIGGGLGYVSAVLLGKSGKKVALIEKNLANLGGTCLHSGCIPSKNLLHRAKTLMELKEPYFENRSSINMQKLQNHIQNVIISHTDSIKAQLKKAGVELIEGKACVNENGVEVNNARLSAKNIILACGSTPRIPENLKLSQRVITSDTALKLSTVPKEISIYGSGAIGLEMAGFFASLSCRVNLIYRHSKISSKIPPEIVNAIETQLKKAGVNLIPNTQITSAVTKNGKAVFMINSTEYTSDYLLLTTGRTPNTSAVKTDKIKVQKAIVCDEYFQTSMPGVFAIGDCNGKLMLAHSARAQAINVANQILGKKEKLNLQNIPKFIYTLPLSYASIGYASIGEKSEKSETFYFKNLGISKSYIGDENGIITVYSKNGKISGADIFAPYAEELIGTIAVAINANAGINDIKKSVFPHPTYSEAIERALRKFRSVKLKDK